ncbi:structural maintenance of chromosomes protein 4 [Episyrphus balteatus]|uniref:structural maintenance of chromosomes protein 4 n=1 Tax=Episyrphus balteatus TaxID=286459 RepID=UPI002485B1BC|nr:structural maintenance of chromosomes protein 4 [Episyrphus balteatus]
MASKRKSLGKPFASGHQKTTQNPKNQDNPDSETEDNNLDAANLSDDEEGGTRIGDIYIPPPIKPYCSTESKGPRLIIKQIENVNFKSYAGKVVLGPFHHCFTAIIGPNGSGKSNVIDSMLFVFGYRAQKIRCKKLSVLLHNSARYPNMQRCSVAVHFIQVVDKEDGSCEEIANTDIVVERTAFRDNTSYYTINGRRVQFKEVAKLLKQHNIDLDHNRFLILQGEVESIAMMKPKGQTENECGMLEYLEDIVGTTRYKEPLVKINSRVEQLTEERTEKHNRCKLAEREMKDLEQPYNEAVEYLKLENQLTRTTNLQIQKYLSEKNKKLEEYTKEQEGIATELKEHDAEVVSLKTERLAKEKAMKEEMAQFEKLQKNVDQLKQNHEKALSDVTEVQTTMQATNKRRKQNKTQLEKLENELIDLHKVPEKNKKEIEECEKKCEKLSKQKGDLEEQLQRNYTELEEQTKPLIEQREVLETELIDLKKNVDEAKADLALSEQELKILKHDETQEKRKYESLKTSFDDSQTGLDQKQEKLHELQQTIPELVKQMSEKTIELQTNRKEEEALQARLLSLKAEINEKVSSFQATRSNNRVLDFLMKQKNEGKIPGILGRLGDLGAIESRYDVAISTACGRLDNIIVDCVNTAQQCIEYLKRYDVGRASFIALEKVCHLQNQMQRINTPENAPRLFDLVKVEDERVLPAFYFALRNTLVATDLEQGSRIAYGARRYRVVTLNGDLIETSGTMSGGGRTQIRGKMGTKVQTKTKPSDNESSLISQKALEDMQVQAEEIQSRINFCQEEQGRLERELYQLNGKKQSLEAEINKLNITINSLKEQLPRIKDQLQAQKIRMEKTTSDAAKVSQIEAQIAVKRKSFEQSDNAANKITTKIDEIKKKIENIHGEKVKSVQNKINNLNKQIKTLTNNVSKLNVEITTSERNWKKTETKIESLKNEIKTAEDEIRALSVDREKLNVLAAELLEKFEAAKTEIENANSESSNVSKEIGEIQKKENALTLKRVEIEQNLQTIEKKIADVKRELPHWRNKLKPLKLHEIPGETEPVEPLKTFTEEELATHKLQDIQYMYSVQEQKLESKKPNLSCIQEYINKREVYLERVKVLEDITTKRNEMRQLYDDVRKKRYNEFMQGFHIITRKLKEMYQMITQGGDAELELVDSMDPFTEGVSFSVRPPKKTWKNISNLSGGEKTLSSLALVFALHYYKPSPLYFMDEIDAALDFKNISIVAHYIKERTKNAQFIIISLRSNMFELSDFIVGIFKVRDCTDAVTIRNKIVTNAIRLTQNETSNELGGPVPQSESTALSQTLITNNEHTIISQVSSIELNATSSITDSFFKKPKPPPPQTSV